VVHKKGRVKSYSVLIIICFGNLIAKENENWFVDKIKQPHVGNFALPVSQQPGPLIAFGQNMPDKGVLQFFLLGNNVKGTQRSFSEIVPSILYGITDRFSLFVEVPVIIKFKEEQFTSHGISDLIVQFEGVTFIQETEIAVNEVTLVGNITLPSGSFNKVPATGFGSPTFFLGFTAGHTGKSWYYFTSMGGVITTRHKNVKFGNQFLYQFGLGRNIAYKADKWILNWLVELDGLYAQRSLLSNVVQRNSGGNSLLLGPSLWFSTQNFIIQGGISGFITQHLSGVQLKNRYLLSAYAGWTF
jgi:hypothetical protein